MTEVQGVVRDEFGARFCPWRLKMMRIMNIINIIIIKITQC